MPDRSIIVEYTQKLINELEKKLEDPDNFVKNKFAEEAAQQYSQSLEVIKDGT